MTLTTGLATAGTAEQLFPRTGLERGAGWGAEDAFPKVQLVLCGGSPGSRTGHGTEPCQGQWRACPCLPASSSLPSGRARQLTFSQEPCRDRGSEGFALPASAQTLTTVTWGQGCVCGDRGIPRWV